MPSIQLLTVNIKEASVDITFYWRCKFASDIDPISGQHSPF